MGKIKTALEIAMEKANKIEVNKEEIKKIEFEKKAGILTNKLLEGEEVNLKQEFENLSKEEKKFIIETIEKTLLNGLVLSPNFNELQYNKIINALKKIKEKPGQIDAIKNDVKSLLQTYSDQLKQYYEQLKQQFSTQLDALKKQLGAQLGAEADIDPSSHPEFQKYWNEIKTNIDEQFKSHIEQIKQMIKSLKNLY